MLKRDSAQPLYAQFEEIVRQKVTSGEWPVDSLIPSENKISALYGISRMTVRAALNRLSEEGFLYRVQGKGTFVAEPKIVSQPLSQMGIRAQLESMGYETSTKLLSVDEELVSVSLAEKLGVAARTEIYIVRRMRFVEGVPFSFHRSYIPKELCPDLDRQDLVSMQLCEIQEQIYHHEIIRRVETLESITASSEESKLLNVRKNAPLLLFENLVYTHENRPVECSKVVFRADKIKLRLEYVK